MKPKFAFAGILCITLALFFAAGGSWGGAFVTSADVMFILFSGGCTVLGLIVVRRFAWRKPRGTFGLTYLGLFLGMLFVFFGDVTGGIYDAVLGATPFPSFADAFYLVGYAVASVALLQFLWFFRNAIGQWAYKLVPLFGVSAGGLALVFYLSSSAAHVPIVALDALYPVSDGFLVMLGVMILLCFRSRFISPPWFWFAMGVLMIGIAHFLNGLGNTEGWYHFPDTIDLLYLWGYVSFGLGFSIQAKPEEFWKSNSN